MSDVRGRLWATSEVMSRSIRSLPELAGGSKVVEVFGSNTFDVPPGKSSKAYEFTLPVGGRLLGVGGHMHDYGVRVRLEDAETGKVITSVVATRDSAGKVSKISRKLYGVSGEGLKLKANHRYRVVGEYDNPTNETKVKGAMAHMVGLFVPFSLFGIAAPKPLLILLAVFTFGRRILRRVFGGGPVRPRRRWPF